MLKIYNTLTRTKQPFKPLNKELVSIYSCGPTVYGRPHIGNLSSFLSADLLKRYLMWSGYKVKHVMNLTDVDDKTITGSIRAGVSLETFTRPFIADFFHDIEELNIEKADVYPKATDYIPAIVRLIKILIQKKYAYVAEDGSVYFRIKNFPRYGKLARLERQKLKAGARVTSDNYEKRNVSDFALWKAWVPEDGDVFWETELGRGRPGWHIECSAMSTSLLGPTIDLHTGAIDLKFPHHTNEIAQSEGATGKTFVRYWVHRSFLRMGKQKMAKSLGNVVNLDDIKNRKFQPKVFRYLVLSNHYRTPLIFTDQAVKAAANSLKSVEEFIRRLEKIEINKGRFDAKKLIEKTKKDFQKYMDDDLNTPRALAVLFQFIKKVNQANDKQDISQATAQKIRDFVYDLDSIFGFLYAYKSKIDLKLNEEERRLIDERATARANKDFKKADEIREELSKRSIEVRDGRNGQQEYVINR